MTDRDRPVGRRPGRGRGGGAQDDVTVGWHATPRLRVWRCGQPSDESGQLPAFRVPTDSELGTMKIGYKLYTFSCSRYVLCCRSDTLSLRLGEAQAIRGLLSSALRLQSRGRLCRGTPEPHRGTLGLAGLPAGPGSGHASSCWGPACRACQAFSVGRARHGSGLGRTRAGPGPGAPARAAAGRPDLGMLGSARTVPTVTVPGLNWVTVALTVCITVSVYTVTARLSSRCARVPLDRGGRTGRRFDAVGPPGTAR
jgi:hypothetical protein